MHPTVLPFRTPDGTMACYVELCLTPPACNAQVTLGYFPGDQPLSDQLTETIPYCSKPDCGSGFGARQRHDHGARMYPLPDATGYLALCAKVRAEELAKARDWATPGAGIRVRVAVPPDRDITRPRQASSQPASRRVSTSERSHHLRMVPAGLRT
jgi:hypothetical protein